MQFYLKFSFSLQTFAQLHYAYTWQLLPHAVINLRLHSIWTAQHSRATNDMLHSSVYTLLMLTGFASGKIWPHTEMISFNCSPKNLSQVSTLVIPTPAVRDFLANGWNVTIKRILFIAVFGNSPICQIYQRIFALDVSNDADSPKIGLLLVLFILLPIWWPQTPKNHLCWNE